MSLTDLVARVEANEKTLTVVNAAEETVEALIERFADRNLTVERVDAPGGPDGYAVLSRDGAFLTAVDVSALLGDRAGTAPGFERASYERILDHLDETLFTAYEREQMLAASREIEDRAWRLGTGELHAGFQTLDRFERQFETYRRLGGRGTLDVHAYVAPDGSPSASSPAAVTLHVEDAPEIRTTWFVVYDGGGVDVSKCALVAEERDPGRFYGFWTYDAGTVDRAVSHLRSTYESGESDGGDQWGAVE